ncbi:hypothetical protein H696_02032 [Fonticula alba]|uniref:Uncharacterized protein n=1 Tax=Fonticula alba TaxID=691883 RepID=A0A058ZAY7_FONAL|nr:hypothetical protein H696_02032 [Fonticula alba]KCV71083.1 hypothetical protein H696_02032 [Fonticula alba]|eukprot:XP_009494206.1 hypothetical protein H696_02032 [Fonticula alba]
MNSHMALPPPPGAPLGFGPGAPPSAAAPTAEAAPVDFSHATHLPSLGLLSTATEGLVDVVAAVLLSQASNADYPAEALASLSDLLLLHRPDRLVTFVAYNSPILFRAIVRHRNAEARKWLAGFVTSACRIKPELLPMLAPLVLLVCRQLPVSSDPETARAWLAALAILTPLTLREVLRETIPTRQAAELAWRCIFLAGLLALDLVFPGPAPPGSGPFAGVPESVKLRGLYLCHRLALLYIPADTRSHIRNPLPEALLPARDQPTLLAGAVEDLETRRLFLLSLLDVEKDHPILMYRQLERAGSVALRLIADSITTPSSPTQLVAAMSLLPQLIRLRARIAQPALVPLVLRRTPRIWRPEPQFVAQRPPGFVDLDPVQTASLRHVHSEVVSTIMRIPGSSDLANAKPQVAHLLAGPFAAPGSVPPMNSMLPPPPRPMPVFLSRTIAAVTARQTQIGTTNKGLLLPGSADTDRQFGFAAMSGPGATEDPGPGARDALAPGKRPMPPADGPASKAPRLAGAAARSPAELAASVPLHVAVDMVVWGLSQVQPRAPVPSAAPGPGPGPGHGAHDLAIKAEFPPVGIPPGLGFLAPPPPPAGLGFGAPPPAPPAGVPMHPSAGAPVPGPGPRPGPASATPAGQGASGALSSSSSAGPVAPAAPAPGPSVDFEDFPSAGEFVLSALDRALGVLSSLGPPAGGPDEADADADRQAVCTDLNSLIIGLISRNMLDAQSTGACSAELFAFSDSDPEDGADTAAASPVDYALPLDMPLRMALAEKMTSFCSGRLPDTVQLALSWLHSEFQAASLKLEDDNAFAHYDSCLHGLLARVATSLRPEWHDIRVLSQPAAWTPLQVGAPATPSVVLLLAEVPRLTETCFEFIAALCGSGGAAAPAASGKPFSFPLLDRESALRLGLACAASLVEKRRRSLDPGTTDPWIHRLLTEILAPLCFSADKASRFVAIRFAILWRFDPGASPAFTDGLAPEGHELAEPDGGPDIGLTILRLTCRHFLTLAQVSQADIDQHHEQQPEADQRPAGAAAAAATTTDAPDAADHADAADPSDNEYLLSFMVLFVVLSIRQPALLNHLVEVFARQTIPEVRRLLISQLERTFNVWSAQSAGFLSAVRRAACLEGLDEQLAAAGPEGDLATIRATKFASTVELFVALVRLACTAKPPTPAMLGLLQEALCPVVDMVDVLEIQPADGPGDIVPPRECAPWQSDWADLFVQLLSYSLGAMSAHQALAVLPTVLMLPIPAASKSEVLRCFFDGAGFPTADQAEAYLGQTLTAPGSVLAPVLWPCTAPLTPEVVLMALHQLRVQQPVLVPPAADQADGSSTGGDQSPRLTLRGLLLGNEICTTQHAAAFGPAVAATVLPLLAAGVPAHVLVGMAPGQLPPRLDFANPIPLLIFRTALHVHKHFGEMADVRSACLATLVVLVSRRARHTTDTTGEPWWAASVMLSGFLRFCELLLPEAAAIIALAPALPHATVRAELRPGSRLLAALGHAADAAVAFTGGNAGAWPLPASLEEFAASSLRPQCRRLVGHFLAHGDPLGSWTLATAASSFVATFAGAATGPAAPPPAADVDMAHE